MEKNNEIRPLILSRNSQIAPHRYPVLYTGKSLVDWKTLKKITHYQLQ